MTFDTSPKSDPEDVLELSPGHFTFRDDITDPLDRLFQQGVANLLAGVMRPSMEEEALRVNQISEVIMTSARVYAFAVSQREALEAKVAQISEQVPEPTELDRVKLELAMLQESMDERLRKFKEDFPKPTSPTARFATPPAEVAETQPEPGPLYPALKKGDPVLFKGVKYNVLGHAGVDTEDPLSVIVVETFHPHEGYSASNALRKDLTLI